MNLFCRKILVTGASGFIGRSLCAELSRRGVPVAGTSRDVSKLDSHICAPIQIGDIGPDSDWSGMLDGVDTIIHLAARAHILCEDAADPLGSFRYANLLGTERLARCAVAGGAKRLVYVSSIGVNGFSTSAGMRFSEADTPAPHNDYSLSKWEAEQALWRISRETGLEVVIVRPPLVYGGNAPGNFAQMLKALKRGIPLPLASVRNLRSLIYLGNLVDALILCAVVPEASRKTYLVSDGEDISTPELLRKLGAGMGRPARLFPYPPRLLEMAGAMVGKSAQGHRLLGSLQIDSGKIRRELNWTPPYTLQQGLQATAEWYRDTHL